MTRWTLRTGWVLIWSSLLFASLSLGCGPGESGSEAEHAAGANDDAHEEAAVAGANGGRLLRSGAFALDMLRRRSSCVA